MINKKAIATLTAASLALFSASAMADSAWNTNQNPIVAANNEVGIAATGTLMNYQEHNLNPIDDTETGWMPGFKAKYSLMGNYFSSLPSDIYFAVRYQYSSAGIAYKGSYIGSATPLHSTDNATTNRVLVRFGKGFTLANDVMLTPYVAGGYQNWSRALPGNTEDYHSGLIGVGAMVQYAATQALVFTANAEGLAMISGGMTPSLYSGALGSTSFETSGQEKIAADVDYRVYGQWHLYGGLSLTHFNYTGGLLKYGFFEPSSSTNLLNMDAGIAYQF